MLTQAQVRKFPKVFRLYCPEAGRPSSGVTGPVFREYPTEAEQVAACVVLKTALATYYRETFHRAWVVRVTGNPVKSLGDCQAVSAQTDFYYLTEKEAKRVATLWKLTGAEAQVMTRDMWPNGDRVL